MRATDQLSSARVTTLGIQKADYRNYCTMCKNPGNVKIQYAVVIKNCPHMKIGNH